MQPTRRPRRPARWWRACSYPPRQKSKTPEPSLRHASAERPPASAPAAQLEQNFEAPMRLPKAPQGRGGTEETPLRGNTLVIAVNRAPSTVPSPCAPHFTREPPDFRTAPCRRQYVGGGVAGTGRIVPLILIAPRDNSNSRCGMLKEKRTDQLASPASRQPPLFVELQHHRFFRPPLSGEPFYGKWWVGGGTGR